MSTYLYGTLAALGGAVIYANLPTKWTIGAIAPTADYLSKAFLIPIKDEHNVNREDGSEVNFLFSSTNGVRHQKFFLLNRLW